MQWSLTARPPFSLGAVVQSHGWVQLAPFRALEADPGFSYCFRFTTGRVALGIVGAGDPDILVSFDVSLAPAEKVEAEQQLAWMLDLDRDLAPFHQLAAAEPSLAHVPAGAHGRLLRSPTLFEDTVKTILTTNTTWGGTRRMVASIVERFGEPCASEAGARAFPTPEQLAEAPVDVLRDATRLGYRAPYVRQLALDVASGALDLESLKNGQLATSELHKRLLAIKGVGPYAAANLLMILGRYDFIPIDSWAFKMVSLEWHDGQPVGKKEVEAAFSKWGSWRGLAYWFWNWSNRQV